MSGPDQVKAAIAVAVEFGSTDGAHHKQWVIDQMVRHLTGCPTVRETAHDCKGEPYEFDALGESPEYTELVREAKAGEDGPETYEWDEGIAP